MDYTFKDNTDVNEYTIDRLDSDVADISALAEDFCVRARKKEKKNIGAYGCCEEEDILFPKEPRRSEKRNFHGQKYDFNLDAIESAPRAEIQMLGAEWPAPWAEEFEKAPDDIHNYIEDKEDTDKKMNELLKSKFGK